jgi:hypothetical protein
MLKLVLGTIYNLFSYRVLALSLAPFLDRPVLKRNLKLGCNAPNRSKKLFKSGIFLLTVRA